MKKLTILFLCFFVLAVQARVIENPKYTYRKTNDIQLIKLELLDTATILALFNKSQHYNQKQSQTICKPAPAIMT